MYQSTPSKQLCYPIMPGNDYQDVLRYCSIRQQPPESWESLFEKQRHLFSSSSAFKNARRLCRNSILSVAFDPLLVASAMRKGMRISTLHTLLSAKCDEEAAFYLSHIRNVWLRIVGPADCSLDKVTAGDVAALELRCPKHCHTDAEVIRRKLENGSIFNNFGVVDRQGILEAILSVDCLIPSLTTFFRDMYLLLSCATAMKHIALPTGQDRTIRTRLMAIFQPSTQKQPELSNKNKDSTEFDVAVSILWSFALRNHQQLPPPKKWSSTKVHSKPPLADPDLKTQLEFRALAERFGFKVPEVGQSLQASPHRESLENHRGAREHLEIEHLSSGSTTQVQQNLKLRCGRPKDVTFQQDRQFLTYDQLLGEAPPHLTSLFVLRCQFLAFFGCSQLDKCRLESAERVSGKQGDGRHEANQGSVHVGDTAMALRTYSAASYTSSISSDDQDQCHEAMVAQTTDGTYLKILTFIDGQFALIARIDAGDPAEIFETAKHVIRDRDMKLYSENLNPLLPEDCYSAVLSSRTKTIIAFSADQLAISDELEHAISLLPSS